MSLNENAYEVLVYADDLAIIVEGRSSLDNIFNILDKLSLNNGIKIDKLKRVLC